MELEKIYQAIITGRAMLITGSGAHMTALGMNGEKFPSGVALAERLYKSAGIVNPENPYDLQDAADSYLETKSSDELIAELKYSGSVVKTKIQAFYNEPISVAELGRCPR